MFAEGDVANIIVPACIWRRIATVEEPSVGVILRGSEGEPDVLDLRRFLVRNYYPHRVVWVKPAAEFDAQTTVQMPTVELLDGRVLASPTLCNLADELGITELPAPHTIYDVAIVGAAPPAWRLRFMLPLRGCQPLWLKGLRQVGRRAPVQKIENYLGFPTEVQERNWRAVVTFRLSNLVFSSPFLERYWVKDKKMGCSI